MSVQAEARLPGVLLHLPGPQDPLPLVPREPVEADLVLLLAAVLHLGEHDKGSGFKEALKSEVHTPWCGLVNPQ